MTSLDLFLFFLREIWNVNCSSFLEGRDIVCFFYSFKKQKRGPGRPAAASHPTEALRPVLLVARSLTFILSPFPLHAHWLSHSEFTTGSSFIQAQLESLACNPAYLDAPSFLPTACNVNPVTGCKDTNHFLPQPKAVTLESLTGWQLLGPPCEDL